MPQHASWQLDTSVFREIRLAEARSLQFRCEVFNVLNARVWTGSIASTDITSSSYGLLNRTILPRSFQLSARFNF
jgi:hypothetical protein